MLTSQGPFPLFIHSSRNSLMLSRSVLGVALASAAGIFWGSMSIAAQYLMESVAFDTVDLTALLLTGAGVLLALEAFVLREDVFAPFRDGRDRRDLVFYALGMLGIQLAFFLSIRDANAATAALTVTTGPLFVTGWTARAPRRHEGRMDFDRARHGGRFPPRHQRRLLDS